ncbi:MAG TPA: aminotransferase class I/II-fold pyridoxal phosphate-dependent enzyme [Thermosynechococcaceae cyanobacterium]
MGPDLSFFSRQLAMPLVKALQECAQRNDAPFYTPGHKRGQGVDRSLTDLLGSKVFRADLPELPELDNLFAPQGAIQAAQELAAIAFGADRTWFLVNGSTSGIIAAILSTCGSGDKILMPRNVHQSAIAGLIHSGAVPVFLLPEYDRQLDLAHSITPEAVRSALAQHPDAKAVLMVYPTYHGAGGDVAAIAQIAHQHSIPLIVDEAHGAHFAFHPELPIAALAAGADLVVQSTHKTLAAMTQAAMLHLRGDRVAGDRISRALQLVQSTSPSYLLLASLDAARQQMATQGHSLMERTLHLSDCARDRLTQIPKLAVLQPEQAVTPGFCKLDRTRLTVIVSELGLTGYSADEFLHEQCGVTAELPSLHHLTFILSLGNTSEDVDRLVQGFQALAGKWGAKNTEKSELKIQASTPLPFHLFALTPREAFFSATQALPIAQTIDRISAELVCPYPPGIPVLMPGEVVTEVAIHHLQTVLASGGILSGCTDPTLQTLKIVNF